MNQALETARVLSKKAENLQEVEDGLITCLELGLEQNADPAYARGLQSVLLLLKRSQTLEAFRLALRSRQAAARSLH